MAAPKAEEMKECALLKAYSLRFAPSTLGWLKS